MLMPPTGTTIGFGVLPLEEFDFPAIPQSSGSPLSGSQSVRRVRAFLATDKDLVGDMADEGLGWSRGGSRSSGER
jgi:hypothetical protein